MRHFHQPFRPVSLKTKAAIMAGLALGIVLSGCSGGDPKAKEKGATDSNKTQLFTVPKEQLSHIQVVTVQPMSWPRVLRLNGTVAYNSFLTTPVISQHAQKVPLRIELGRSPKLVDGLA